MKDFCENCDARGSMLGCDVLYLPFGTRTQLDHFGDFNEMVLGVKPFLAG